MVWSRRMGASWGLERLEGTVEMIRGEELGAQPRVVRALPRDLRPERARVVHVAQVRELVADHVVDEAERSLHQAPGEPYLAARIAAPPARHRGGDHEPGRLEVRAKRQ